MDVDGKKLVFFEALINYTLLLCFKNFESDSKFQKKKKEKNSLK